MLVSAIIPSYNRQERTVNAVQSVLAQSYKNIEVIVVDDGSIKPLDLGEPILLDSRVKVFRVEHGGVSAARNFGVSNSNGELLAFLDSDDQWLEDKVATQVSQFVEDEKVKLCHCDEEWIRNGVRVNPKKSHRKASGQSFSRSIDICCISPSAVMIRREVFELIGTFDERLRVCEDYDYWLRFTAKFPVYLIDRPLVRKFGGHSDQLSRSEPAIDRFRVFSLVKLLVQDKLAEEQKKLVIAGIRKRLSVLLQGARKFDNKSLIRCCNQIESLLHLDVNKEMLQVAIELIEMQLPARA